MLKKGLETMKNNVYPTYLTEDKTMLKSLSRKTKSWIKRQNYISRCVHKDHVKNTEDTLQIRFSFAFLTFLGFSKDIHDNFDDS